MIGVLSEMHHQTFFFFVHVIVINHSRTVLISCSSPGDYNAILMPSSGETCGMMDHRPPIGQSRNTMNKDIAALEGRESPLFKRVRGVKG